MIEAVVACSVTVAMVLIALYWTHRIGRQSGLREALEILQRSKREHIAQGLTRVLCDFEDEVRELIQENEE